MIDFRYHVVSLVAVFLALALGLFIGSTTLRPKVAQDLKHRTDQLAAKNGALKSQLSAATDRAADDEAFDTAIEPYVVAGRLVGRSVVVVSLPGADSGQRDAVEHAITAAGATLTGDVRLDATLLDPDQDAFLATLADRVAVPNRTLSGGSGNQRALALLADVLGLRPRGQPVPAAAAAKVLSAYAAGNLLSFSGDQPQPAALVVVLAASPPEEGTATPSPSPTPSPQDLVAGFVRALDEAAVGTVVVGPSAAAESGGVLAAVRDDKDLRTVVSTVDGSEFPRGAIATVFALAEQANGGAGSYGSARNADRSVPELSPSP